MKQMKKEEVSIPKKIRKTKKYASKSASFAVIAAVACVMIATLAQGIKLDKEEAKNKEDSTL